MYAIGIDIGTTSICGVKVSLDKKNTVKSITRNSNAYIKGTADFEKIQSVDRILDVALGILHELIDGDVKVIGVTGQMHGILYTNKNGDAVSPLYTWEDGRGNLPYKDTTYAEYLKTPSGYGNVTDFYNRKNGLVPSDAVGYCTIHDYLVMKLCSLKKAQIHVTDAASFGLFDILKNSFDYENGIDVITDYKIAGEYKGIPVAVAIGDNQASVLSSLDNEEKILINVGTGSQVTAITDKIIDAENIEMRPFFEGKYIAVGAALCGGRAYSLLKDFFKSALSPLKPVTDDEVYKIMQGYLDESEEELEVDTRFAGTRRDNTVKGSIVGISTENLTPSAMTRGVLSGMINELYEMIAPTGVKIQGIVGSGNGIRKNRALIEIAEKKFSLKMQVPCHTEEAAMGATMFALIAVGYYKNIKEAVKQIKYT